MSIETEKVVRVTFPGSAACLQDLRDAVAHLSGAPGTASVRFTQQSDEYGASRSGTKQTTIEVTYKDSKYQGPTA